MTSQFMRCLCLVTILCGAAVLYVNLYTFEYKHVPGIIPNVIPVPNMNESGSLDQGLTTFTYKRITTTQLLPEYTNSTPFNFAVTVTVPATREKTAALNQTRVLSRFDQRRELLRNACQRHSGLSDFNYLRIEYFLDLPLYKPVMNVTVGYCPIQKAASSTVWKLITDIRREMAHRGIFGVSVFKQPGEHDVSFVFVREPYGRLLSAYVDKLFSPNADFWHKTGRYIAQNFRRKASKESLQCGHDVTFSEFIQFFIEMQMTGKNRDGHFVPIHDHCEMCLHPYKYIGHVETIHEDLPFILKAIHSPVTYNETYSIHTIEKDASMVLHGMRTPVQKCMDLDEACRRLWKKWQVRGLIKKTQPFPLSREETRNISLLNFQQAAIAALDLSHLGQKEFLKQQRKEALREAFASVSMIDRLEVKRLLSLDFEMFGFDPEPQEVFPEKLYKPNHHFSYFDLYT